MEELNPGPLPGTNRQRPTLLTVLCILTFIGSGMNLFSSLFIAAFYDVFVEFVRQFAEKFNFPGMDVLLETKPVFFLASGICYAGSLTGAIFMMRLKKPGFHIYTISQILLIIAPMYYMHMSGPGLPETIFAGLFVLLYGMNLKYMS